jgi:Sec-independent protein secretion pathway components
MPGWGQILIVLFIVLLVFGAEGMGTLGSDLGESLIGFFLEMSADNDPDRDS